jgi:hypothetical protein
MRKTNLTQLAKAAGAYVVVSGLTVDTALALADSARLYDVPGAWYLHGPMLAYVAAGVPLSISLAERALKTIDDRPGAIVADVEGNGPARRGIPFTARGKPGTLFASTVASIFDHQEVEDSKGRERRPAVWHVPVGDDNWVTVRESELRAFLDTAYKRKKHQFSRNYWTKSRRPALWEVRYSAFMRLLTEAGLVEGRAFGASGRLVMFPREAIMYLKYESQFAV